MRPAWQAGEFTDYASVHAFKGMENRVVIVTDVSVGEPDFHRCLFYTGMTRATGDRPRSMRQNCQQTLMGWFSGKIAT